MVRRESRLSKLKQKTATSACHGVDSSVWIDFFHGGVSTSEVERLDRQLGTTPIGIADLIFVPVVSHHTTGTPVIPLIRVRNDGRHHQVGGMIGRTRQAGGGAIGDLDLGRLPPLPVRRAVAIGRRLCRPHDQRSLRISLSSTTIVSVPLELGRKPAALTGLNSAEILCLPGLSSFVNSVATPSLSVRDSP